MIEKRRRYPIHENTGELPGSELDFGKRLFPEKVIRDFIERRFSYYFVFWMCVSRYQNLSESFIRDYREHLRWDYISGDYYMSESFLIEFCGFIDMTSLSTNPYVSEKVKNRIINLKKVQNA